MSASAASVEAGHAVYGRRTLALYDAFVLGFSNRFLWRCPSAQLEAHFSQYVSANHLDVGVGSGYFLDRARFPDAAPRLALMDLNAAALHFAARRLARYQPERYQHNVLAPMPSGIAPFASISLNYVLHCLPGQMAGKASALEHLSAVLQPGAWLFGASILADAGQPNWAARRLMALYNRRGIFSNCDDKLPDLCTALHTRFDEVRLHTQGCVALFAARKASDA